MQFLSVDLHTHILPGIDDGCPSAEEAVRMLRMEYEQGVKTVFLTPHFRGQNMYPNQFLESRQASYDAMLSALSANDLIPQLVLGAEVRYCPGMSAWEQLTDLTLGNTNCILIEMPFGYWPASAYQELKFILNERKLVPILAHIERYFLPFRKRSMLKSLLEIPVLLQCNASFFTERRTRAFALKLFKENRVHFIGSDCHSATWRAPNIGFAREILRSHTNEAEQDHFNKLEKTILLDATRF